MKLYIAIAALLLPFAATAQHELSIHAGGGLSTLNYNLTTGKQTFGFGGQFGIGYRYFFSPSWAVGTGVEFALYNTTYSANELSSRHAATDPAGVAFEFRSTVNKYEETQNAGLLQIPLMVQFQSGGKHKFYAAAGGKAGIPLCGAYSGKATAIANAGYYNYENGLYDTQEFMGFGTFTSKRGKGDLDFKTAFFASAEIGMKWKLNDGLSLYTGAYLDYGLNNVQSVKTQGNASLPPFVEYNTASPRDFAVNSALQAFTDRVRPVAAGITLRLAFGSGSTAKPEPSAVE